jgi:hypothetical protein
MQAVTKFLSKLNAEINNEQEIKSLINSNPDVLSEVNEHGCLPIQVAAYNYQRATDSWNTSAVPFIPILAEEGAKLNVGGEGMRGGLLHENRCKNNAFQHLAWISGNDNKNPGEKERIDLLCMGVLRKLSEMGFLLMEDVEKYNLLRLAFAEHHRFCFLANLNPNLLKKTQKRGGGSLLLHDCAKSQNIDIFRMVLTLTIQHFPTELGLLFVKDRNGMSSYQIIRMRYGNQGACRIIEECFDAVRDMKSNMNSESVFLQIALASTNESLDLVFHLLRRNPTI